MMITYIGIGSNVGNRSGFCRDAVAALEESGGLKIEALSSLYETTPVGGPPQRSFINMVARAFTELEASALLKTCHMIERRLGREGSEIRWGPRVIDLDILLYGEESIDELGLLVPHPRMRERRFVLVPLLEIYPEVAGPDGVPYADSLPGAEGEVKLAEPFIGRPDIS